jgi:CBS domain-containing protein
MSIRGITLFLFGGVAEIADEPPSARVELLMAIAGPVVSAVLAVAFGVLAWAGYAAGWAPPVVVVLGYLALINATVLVFNLVPAFPLDGGRVLRSILWGATGNLRRATYAASLAGRGFAWLLISWAVLHLFTGDWLGGIWIGLVGLFLNNAAQASYQQVLVRQALRGEPLRRFMTPDPIAVPPSVDLLTWVEDFVYRYQRKAFPVVTGDRLEGLVDTDALAGIPRAEWQNHTVGEVMRRDLGELSVAPQTDAAEALGRMQRLGVSRLLVVDGDRLVGIVSLRDLLNFLALKLELESQQDRPAPPRLRVPNVRQADTHVHP